MQARVPEVLIFAMRGAGLFLVEEAEWQRQRKLLAPTFMHPASTFWRRISTPRQEHQVGRFLGVFEECLARARQSVRAWSDYEQNQ